MVTSITWFLINLNSDGVIIHFYFRKTSVFAREKIRKICWSALCCRVTFNDKPTYLVYMNISSKIIEGMTVKTLLL